MKRQKKRAETQKRGTHFPFPMAFVAGGCSGNNNNRSEASLKHDDDDDDDDGRTAVSQQ